jgi:hypothetical protein
VRLLVLLETSRACAAAAGLFFVSSGLGTVTTPRPFSCDRVNANPTMLAQPVVFNAMRRLASSRPASAQTLREAPFPPKTVFPDSACGGGWGKLDLRICAAREAS